MLFFSSALTSYTRLEVKIDGESKGQREGFLLCSMAATTKNKTHRTCYGSRKIWEEQELCSSMLEIPLLKQDKSSLSNISSFSQKLFPFL